MKFPRLKTIAFVVFIMYPISIGYTYFFLRDAQITESKKLTQDQISHHKKSHRRPGLLRISHPLFESCLRLDNNYEKLLLTPYHRLGNIYVYSAFVDTRTDTPYVRMIAMIQRPFQKKAWCHFGHGSNIHIAKQAEFYEMCENHHFSYGGWIISCPIPVNLLKRIPCEFFLKETEASLDSYPAIMIPLLQSSTHARELKKQKGRAKIGLCVPPVYGSIEPSRLIKFVALTNTLGFDHIIFYVYNISTSLNSVLEYLEDRGVATMIQWILPMESNHIWSYGQSVAINDCLYRNMFYFKYLAFTDLDEYIVSHVPDAPILSLIYRKLNTNKNLAAFRFRSSFFMRNPTAKDNQSQFDVLEHIYRTEESSIIRSKMIVEPYKIFEVGIHHVSRTWPDSKNYTSIVMNPEDIRVHHYRNCTPTLDLSCTSFVTDSTVPDWHEYEFLTKYNARMEEIKTALKTKDKA